MRNGWSSSAISRQQLYTTSQRQWHCIDGADIWRQRVPNDCGTRLQRKRSHAELCPCPVPWIIYYDSHSSPQSYNNFGPHLSHTTFVLLFFRPLAQSRRLKIVQSKVWLQRRLIGVKSVEEGATAFPLWRAIDNCWNRKVDSLGSPVINRGKWRIQKFLKGDNVSAPSSFIANKLYAFYTGKSHLLKNS